IEIGFGQRSLAAAPRLGQSAGQPLDVRTRFTFRDRCHGDLGAAADCRAPGRGPVAEARGERSPRATRCARRFPPEAVPGGAIPEWRDAPADRASASVPTVRWPGPLRSAALAFPPVSVPNRRRVV